MDRFGGCQYAIHRMMDLSLGNDANILQTAVHLVEQR